VDPFFAPEAFLDDERRDFPATLLKREEHAPVRGYADTFPKKNAPSPGSFPGVISR
jgi:hypothetical protein